MRTLKDDTLARVALALQTTVLELTAGLPMSRQAVAKHLGILEAANLVSVVRRGREKLHYLNPVPIGEIVRRWVGKFEDARLDALTDFKEQIETNQEKRRA